jgi:hypothetical protein
LNFELFVKTSPPSSDAAASSNAPVTEALESLEAMQLALSIALWSFSFPNNPNTAEAVATETALELFKPTAGGILELICILNCDDF